MPSQRSTCVPGGTRDHERLAVGAVALGALAVAAAAGAEVRAAAEAPAGRAASRRSAARTSPPRPPSPPSGPPLGTCASRRKDRQPLPPRRRHLDAGAVEHARLSPRRAARYERARLAGVTAYVAAMADDPVFLITGASTGIGAATARHAAEAGYRLVLAARSEDKLRGLARGARRRRARARRPLRRDRVERPGGARARARSTRSAGSTSRSPTPASAARAASPRATPEEWKRDGADERLRRRADDPRDASTALIETQGPPAAHVSRSPAGARCPGRSTRARSTPSPRWARRRGRTSTTPACA